MGKKNRIRSPSTNKQPYKDFLEKKASIKDADQTDCFTVSLKHFDIVQSEGFESPQAKGLLAQSLEVLRGYCQRPLRAQQGKKFTIYGDFPPKDKTIYTHPKHVPEDAEWARIHIDGTTILAGHVFENTFFLVFLDPEHQFYISEKKNT